jgi:hypothetical protein
LEATLDAFLELVKRCGWFNVTEDDDAHRCTE